MELYSEVTLALESKVKWNSLDTNTSTLFPKLFASELKNKTCCDDKDMKKMISSFELEQEQEVLI